MLARVKWLKKKKDFEQVFRQGKGYKEGFLILKAVKNNLDVARFGFIISKKVSKRAVVRNKIKRRLRKIVREKDRTTTRGMDIVLMALPGIETKDFWEIDKTISQLYKKAKL